MIQSVNTLLGELKANQDPLMSSFPEDFDSCGILSPYKWHTRDLSTDTALLFRPDLDERVVRSLILLMHPTYPKGVGEANQALLMEHLSRLSATDHRRWERVTHAMIHEWTQMHQLLGKYLLREEETSESMDRQAQKIQTLAKGGLVDAFITLLKSTDMKPKLSLLQKMELRKQKKG